MAVIAIVKGVSIGYIHKGDAKRGIDTNEIVKTKRFYAPIEKKKNGEYKMKPINWYMFVFVLIFF